MSENASVAKRLEKFPAFDGFRGIGVVVVVFTHCPQVLDSNAYNAIWYANQLSRVGYIALDIFFVISGFFITRLLCVSGPRPAASPSKTSICAGRCASSRSITSRYSPATLSSD